MPKNRDREGVPIVLPGKMCINYLVLNLLWYDLTLHLKIRFNTLFSTLIILLPQDLINRRVGNESILGFGCEGCRGKKAEVSCRGPGQDLRLA